MVTSEEEYTGENLYRAIGIEWSLKEKGRLVTVAGNNKGDWVIFLDVDLRWVKEDKQYTYVETFLNGNEEISIR